MSDDPSGVVVADLNGDGRPDLAVTNQGVTNIFIHITRPSYSHDANANGGPDDCENLCFADYNRDGFVDGIDYDQINNDFEAGTASADINGDGFVDGIDHDELMNHFAVGC